jgi:hypothetical protein
MAKKVINVGTQANDKKGDSLRSAFTKVNENFTELYTSLGLINDADINLGAFEFDGSVMTTTDSTPVTIDQQVNITSDLVMSGAVVPSATNIYDLGSPTKQWRSLYLTGSTVYFNGIPLSVTDDGTIIVNGEVAATPGGDLTWDSIVNKPTTTGSQGITATTDANGNVNIGFSGQLYTGSSSWSFEEIVTGEGEEAVVSGKLSLPLITEIAGGNISLTTINLETINDYTWTFGNDGNLTVPDRITFSDGSWQSTAFVGHAYSLKNNPNGSLYVTLDDSGTINTPLLLPLTFTAVLDSAHKTGDPLTLTDTPWEFTVQFQVNPNGTVETMMNSIFPNLINPGYTTADQFSFTEADHGIPGYTFELELDNLELAGPAGWTASPVVSIPPEYPATIKSSGAIKLTANDQNFVFGTDGALRFQDGVSSISSDIGGGLNGLDLRGLDRLTLGIFNDSWYTTGFGWDFRAYGLDSSDSDRKPTIAFPCGGGIQEDMSVEFGIAPMLIGSTDSLTIRTRLMNPQGLSVEQEHYWTFGNNGSITYPGGIKQSQQDNTQCLPNVDTVVYTATGTDQHAIKLFVMVEGLTDGGGLSWDTQACDVIAVKGFNNNIVHVTTYGVTYSGASAIAEFDGQWNVTTNRIEITCRPTSVTNNVRVSVHAIEMTSND